MTTREPTTEVDSRFGDEGVAPIPWAEGRQVLETASQYWISSVRSDGRPHVTPLVGVWHEDAMYFATGPDEQKARNVASSAVVLGHTPRDVDPDIVRRETIDETAGDPTRASVGPQ